MNTRPNTANHLGNNRVDLTADGGVWQAMDYYPFGLPMASSYLPGKQRWQFGGKEMDRISGLDLLDFEARPYDPATGRFRQPDPLAEIYHPISPYLYCAANPLVLIDYTGQYLKIYGTNPESAIAQIQTYVGNSIKIESKNGCITYTKTDESHNLSAAAKRFAEIVDDKQIFINFETDNGDRTPDGGIYIGGAFLGNEVLDDGNGNITVVAHQLTNPDVLNKASDGNGVPGADAFHELTEAYEGAKISKENGQSSPPSNKPNSVYDKAHENASKQSGEIYETIYDINGKVVFRDKNGLVPPNARSVDYHVIDKDGKKLIIQHSN